MFNLLKFFLNNLYLIDSTDSNGGLSIEFSSGEACPDESGFYSVTFQLKCDPTMQRGIIEFSNEKDFSMKKCRNVLNGRSFESKIFHNSGNFSINI